MAISYRAVGWNRQKRIYDGVLLASVAAYVLVFFGVGATLRPEATPETLMIRAFGTAAFLLLHVVLSIGALCRLSPRFLPLLYNRRHMGVCMFVLALAHGGIATFQFHALGDVNPLVSVLSSNPRVDSISQFPFQPLGLLALVILFLMAATSHDFWLANLTAPVWKGLHMLVYVAYALIVVHVTLGALQSETSVVLTTVMTVGLAWVLGLHLLAALAERRADRHHDGPALDGFVQICGVGDIPEGRARVVSLSGERVAVFRYGDRVSALSNVCQHQNGPLGEGRVIDGCVTCPWHGYQYLPDSGQSPPPFTEKIPTFRARVHDGMVWVHPQPLPPGTATEPARVGSAARTSP